MVHHTRQLQGIRAATGLHINFKPASGAQTMNSRRIKCDRYAIRLLHADIKQLIDDILGGARTLGPVFECYVHAGRAGFIAATDQVETIDDELVGYCRILRNGSAHRFSGFGCSSQTRPIRQNRCGNNVALIFRGHKAAGNDFEEIYRKTDNAGKYEGADDLMPDGHAHRTDIELGEPVEPAVKCPEERGFAMRGFQDDGAQCGRERQRHHTGNYHGNGNGHGELAIEFAGNAAHKGHRHKHRAQHQHNGDHGARNLFHGLNGGFHRRQVFFVHQALDVFQHDNGIIHHDANGQHHGEQCKQVDGEAK